MCALSPFLQHGIEEGVVVQPESLADEALHAVAVHGMLEEALGYTDNNLAHRFFLGARQENVMAFKGMAENFLPVAQQCSDLYFGAEAFLFGKCKMLVVSVFWWHVLSRRRPWRR